MILEIKFATPLCDQEIMALLFSRVFFPTENLSILKFPSSHFFDSLNFPSFRQEVCINNIQNSALFRINCINYL